MNNDKMLNDWKLLGEQVKKAYECDEIQHLEEQLKELQIADSKKQTTTAQTR